MFSSARRTRSFLILLCAVVLTLAAHAADKPKPEPDTLILANGDTLHGQFVKEITGKVTFHTNALGDVTIPWSQIKELHAGERYGVLSKGLKLRRKKALDQIPSGSFDMTNQAITVHPPSAAAPAPIPVANAEFIVDYPTLDKQINHQPNFFTGWNGSATAGATLVQATQNQYTVSGGLGLVRMVPSISWLRPRDRTSFDFSGSYGKITQPGTPTIKSAIYHIDAERDQYISSRLFALAQVSFDHNFALNLQIQQIFGGGLGVTLFDTPHHEADVKATIQYENQRFINAAPGSNQSLIGSTFSADYMLHTSLFTYTQALAFMPAYNTPRAYSADETNTLAFPAYKNFGFSVGTIDTYLNDPPAAVPATKRNSFQFTMGLTYAIKSKY
ncbi:MAG: DUF481 domain-containing protein [Acidobacteriota bacterium]